ncbi:MAG: hypothetical protein ACKO37_09800 [Vampirovibrionales bacterium]
MVSQASLGLQRVLRVDGHLVDSLTLAKIIDTIEQQEATFELNALHIGPSKKDFSFLSLTLFARDTTHLEQVCEHLLPYGVQLEPQRTKENADGSASELPVNESKAMKPIETLAPRHIQAHAPLTLQGVFAQKLPQGVLVSSHEVWPVVVSSRQASLHQSHQWVIAIHADAHTATLTPLSQVDHERETVVMGTQGVLWQ